MPQEAWVLKCYACKKFQAQLKKKAKRWQCKVCGAKQDLMTIYYKGQPSDCRLNVQNMNTAEGEMLEKLQEQCSSPDDSYSHNHEECENISQNLQNHNYFSYDETEEFTDEAIENIDEQCSEAEGAYSEETFKLEEQFEEAAGNITQEGSIVEKESMFNEELSTNCDTNNDEDIFDLNSMDFTIKTFKNSVPNNHKAQVLKLSIFESNSDFDESLDF